MKLRLVLFFKKKRLGDKFIEFVKCWALLKSRYMLEPPQKLCTTRNDKFI